MKKLQLAEFKTYEEEAAYWGNIDTADFMEDDGGWFQFETLTQRVIQASIPASAPKNRTFLIKIEGFLSQKLLFLEHVS